VDDQNLAESIAQRRDELLLRILKTPPQSRAEISERVRREKAGRPSRAKRASGRAELAGGS
jgi:hypothetical protein